MKFTQWLPFGRVPEITAEELKETLHDIQIIDVRSPMEFTSSRIEGARNAPITKFSNTVIENLKLDKNIPVITICLSAHRSIPATRKLNELGYDTKQLKGGMKTWWKKQYPTVNGE